MRVDGGKSSSISSSTPDIPFFYFPSLKGVEKQQLWGSTNQTDGLVTVCGHWMMNVDGKRRFPRIQDPQLVE